ncbi:hypothetical protein AOLI_G00024950 [Acnodon oligacanthus]
MAGVQCRPGRRRPDRSSGERGRLDALCKREGVCVFEAKFVGRVKKDQCHDRWGYANVRLNCRPADRQIQTWTEHQRAGGSADSCPVSRPKTLSSGGQEIAVTNERVRKGADEREEA